MLLSLHPRLYLYMFLYVHQYLLSGDDHDDDHEAYRLHDDEDDDDAEIYFIGLCCETFSSPALAWLAKLQAEERL